MSKGFKVGDRVRVYDRSNSFKATVTNPSNHYQSPLLTVFDGMDYLGVHPKQCRRLKYKRKHIWVKFGAATNENPENLPGAYIASPVKDMDGKFHCIKNEKHGWQEFVEVKR